MNKTVFYAVKEWVRGLIGKVERRIKAVEKDVQKINKKLPNFLTRNYTTDKEIRVMSQEMSSYFDHAVLLCRETPEFVENYEFSPNSSSLMCELFGEPMLIYYFLETNSDEDGVYFWFGTTGGNVSYSSVVRVYGGVELPVGWSLNYYDEAMDTYVVTPFTAPPTVYSYDEDDYNSFVYALEDNATPIEEKWEEYVDYEAGLYNNGRAAFLETERYDGEQSQIGVGPWGVRMTAYGNRVLEFGNNGNRVTGLDEPQDDTDAANKAYVDGKLTIADGKFYQNGEDVTAQVKAALGIS